MNREHFELLKECLGGSGGRFSSYQEIPGFVQAALPEVLTASDYEKRQPNLDRTRLGFLADHLDLNGLDVVEIGSNLGYFGLSMAHSHRCRYTGFEPIVAYSRASELMALMTGLESSCEFHPRGVELSGIAELPSADLVIELNVLHHAGPVFDHAEVERLGDWKAYAVKRLAALREKGTRLYFQTGNSNGSETLFAAENALLFLSDLLREAGWRPQHIGVVADLERLDYKPVPPDNLTSGRTYICQRNADTGLVDYQADGQVIGSLQTGLANRPVWICD